ERVEVRHEPVVPLAAFADDSGRDREMTAPSAVVVALRAGQDERDDRPAAPFAVPREEHALRLARGLRFDERREQLAARERPRRGIEVDANIVGEKRAGDEYFPIGCEAPANDQRPRGE